LSRSRFDSLEQEVFLSLWRTYDRLRALEDELFAQFDLTAQQYNVLRILRSERPRGVATLTLAERLISRAPDVTRMLDKLARRGLIARERQTDDRRIVEVAITEAGLELLGQIAAPLRACHTRQLGHLSEDQLRQLADLLRAARRPHEPPDSVWR